MTSPRYGRTITAGPDDIDELGHVNNAVWVRWIQDVAVEHWHALATPEQHAAYVWVITRHEIDYRGNVVAGETVTAETWVDDAPKGARFDRLMRFTGADGRVKVDARTTWALLDRHSGRLLRVPAEVVERFTQ
ncbi:acyl-CoA thioesterase [Sphingomonas sp. SAFR-052]|uniref:acyl-CoA thioesterase n=1 Tax=Sphingomonas sp. SAFR-052 TaxID=3436867 RepID=UPI003F7E89B7